MNITALSLQMGENDFERRFVWYAENNIKSAAVQYIEKTEYIKNNSFKKAEIAFGNVEKIYNNTEHVSCKVKIENLKPSTEYIYRVGDGTDFSEQIYSFKTPSANKKRSFAVISDLHCMYKPDAPELWEYRRPQWNNTINQINNFDSDISCLISAGDNISSYNMNLEGEEENLRLICEKEHELLFEPELTREIPFATVMGNHEAQYYSEDNPAASVMGYHFYMPNDDGVSGYVPHTTSGNFCFLSGDVLVIGLNFAVDTSGNYAKTDYETNEKYVEWAVNKYPDALWRVVVTHIQGFTFIGDSKGVETPYMMQKQDELCTKFNIDLMLTGHAHGFSRSYPIKNGKADKNAVQNINGTDTVCNAEATVHYNVPSALNHSFTSIAPNFKDYIKSYGVAKMRNETPQMPSGFTEYDSPMFLHIEADENNAENRMTIKVIQSENLKSVDEFIMMKIKNKKQ